MIWLKRYLEDFLGVQVEISKPKKQFGDYSSNVVLKHKENAEKIMDHLNKHELIESCSFVNGHINIFIRRDLLVYQGPLAGHLRMSAIHNRLEKEGYTRGHLDDYWAEMSKLVNELNYSVDHYKETFGLEDDLVKTFEKLDHAYIYRQQSDDLLGGIYQLLNQTLIALGRLS